MTSKTILSVKRRRASISSSSLCPNKRIKTDDGKKGETAQRKIMTKNVGNSVKKQGKIPLQIKRENVPEESTDDDESPIESGISNYEELRLKNLQDNADFFAKLGIAELYRGSGILSSYHNLCLLYNENIMLVAQQDGTVAVVDTRTSNSTAENEYLLHNKSLRTVSVHPVQNNIFCTSSTDCTVCIWDLRKLNKNTKNRPMDEISHGKLVSSAYFSPVTGNYILSTSMDDKISIFNCEKLSSIERQHSISHSNHEKYISQFRATWHPKREDMFVVGSMARPRKIEMYGSNGRKVLELKDEEILGSVCSLNVIGSSQDVVVGANSSGYLHVFM